MNNNRKFEKTMYNNLDKYFDPYEFNKEFDDYVIKENKELLLKEKVKMHDINAVEEKKIYPYQESPSNITIGIKNTWNLLISNIFSGKNMFSSMTNDNVFYFAISFIAIALLYISLSFIFD